MDEILDGKILDLARRLIESQFAERRKILPNEVSLILHKFQIKGMASSSPEVMAVRDACEKEIRKKADIVWENLKKAHKAFGSPITKTLALDLKEDISHHVEKIVKDAFELMSTRLSFMKPSKQLIDFEKTKIEVNEKMGVEVDLYVDSLLYKQVRTGQSKLQEKGEHGNGGNSDSSSEKASESLFLKIYEKTIKALFDAILDKINPS